MHKTTLFLITLICTLIHCQPLKIGVIIDGPLSDFGYNWQIKHSADIIQEMYGNQVQVISSYGITINTQACYNEAVRFINMGVQAFMLPTSLYTACAQMISNNFGHMPILLQSSQPLNPNYPNISTIFKVTGLNELRYLVGVLVGKQKNVETVCTTFNGFINPPSCRLWSNIQYLGFLSANSSVVKYYVSEASSFDNVTQELLVYNHFKSLGCDVIISGINSFYFHMLAKIDDIYSVGWSSDMRQFIGDTVLTSILKNWEVPMAEFIDDIFAGNYTGVVYEDSFTNHGVDLAPLSDRVTKAAARLVEKTEKKIVKGQLNVQCGDPVRQQYGTDCTTEANLQSQYLPGIIAFDARTL